MFSPQLNPSQCYLETTYFTPKSLFLFRNSTRVNVLSEGRRLASFAYKWLHIFTSSILWREFDRVSFPPHVFSSCSPSSLFSLCSSFSSFSSYACGRWRPFFLTITLLRSSVSLTLSLTLGLSVSRSSVSLTLSLTLVRSRSYICYSLSFDVSVSLFSCISIL